jgi:hypothetical protein
MRVPLTKQDCCIVGVTICKDKAHQDQRHLLLHLHSSQELQLASTLSLVVMDLPWHSERTMSFEFGAMDRMETWVLDFQQTWAKNTLFGYLQRCPSLPKVTLFNLLLHLQQRVLVTIMGPYFVGDQMRMVASLAKTVSTAHQLVSELWWVMM